MSRQGDKLTEGTIPLLDAGEQLLGIFMAQPRGHTMKVAGAGAAGGLIGRAVVGKVAKGMEEKATGSAGDVGLRFEPPMALALTQKRLLTIKTGTAVGLGVGGDVKEIMSAVPLAAVDSIEVKRLLVGKVLVVTVSGVPIKLEVGPGADAKGLAEAFVRAKAAA